MLRSIKASLKSYGFEDVLSAKKLMGVWHKKRKLASIGVGMERFVSIHGIALNLLHDQKMFSTLNMINPCGMSSSTYTSVEQEFNQKINPQEFKFISEHSC